MSGHTQCPFCNRDPFHYVDIGVGYEAAAVDCCELGDTFFRGARPAPEEVTLSWEEFREIGSKVSGLNYQAAANEAKIEALEIALRDMLFHFKPFTMKPIGASNSSARLDQEMQIKVHAAARAALQAATGERDDG